MTVGNPGKTLFFFAIPMVVGNLFQQLYSIVDSMVVGNFVGADALAAVGASTAIAFLFVAVATGMSIGSSVVISQLFGGALYGKMKTAILTMLVTALTVGLIFSIVGMVLSESILRVMNTPEEIMADAETYLKIYFAGIIFLFIYNMLTAVFNALGNSRIPLFFLTLSSILNIGLDLLFVIKFKMGVAGVAYATLISQGVSAALSGMVLFMQLRKLKITEAFYWFQMSMLKTVCKIAIPSMIQQSIVSIGMVFVQSLVNSYGPVVMAGYAAATKIDSVAIMPMINVGNAVSNFSAQNLGAKKIERVRQGYRAGLLISGGIACVVTIVLFAWGEIFVGAFVDSASNQEVIKVGVEYLRVVSVFYILMGAMNATNGVLRSAGDIKWFMGATLSNFSSRVILAYALSYFVGSKAIWWAIPIGWGVGFSISYARYRTGRWQKKRLIS